MGLLPYIALGPAIVAGIVLTSLAYLANLPLLAPTINNLASLFPAPFAPPAGCAGTCGPGTVAIAFSIGLFGLAFGFMLKALDAPKKARLGSGRRFKTLTRQLESRPGVRNPQGLAAYIGAKKYGRPKLQRLAAAGRRRR